MLSFKKALYISHNKLKYKQVLIFITTIISSIAISILLLFITTSKGVIKSIDRYTKEALNNEFLVRIVPNIPSDIIWLSSYDLTNQKVADIKSFEKRFPNEVPILNSVKDLDDFEESKTKYVINYKSPLYNKYREQLQLNYAKTANNTLDALEKTKTIF